MKKKKKKNDDFPFGRDGKRWNLINELLPGRLMPDDKNSFASIRRSSAAVKTPKSLSIEL